MVIDFYELYDMLDKEKLIILDRDGVINHDSEDYIKNPDEWIPIFGSLSAIARLNRIGYQVVIATNQSGVDRGYYSLDMLEVIHRKMNSELEKVGGQLAGIYFCPHIPEGNCLCRKPKPGLLHLIAEDFPKVFKETSMVGDNLRDIQVAKAAGCRPILIGKNNDNNKITSRKWLKDVPIFKNLSAYVDHLTLKSL